MGNAAPSQPVVLVIDDSEDIRNLISAVLGKDHRVRVAADGAGGLKEAIKPPSRR